MHEQEPQTRYRTYRQSSAQSSSANPDEDWTKVSDLAERRRIQNRIAQRNYRKKLKRRLEDLEQNDQKKRCSKPCLPSPGQRKHVTQSPKARDDQGGMLSDSSTQHASSSPPSSSQPIPLSETYHAAQSAPLSRYHDDTYEGPPHGRDNDRINDFNTIYSLVLGTEEPTIRSRTNSNDVDFEFSFRFL